eukprot:gene9223-19128_t
MCSVKRPSSASRTHTHNDKQQRIYWDRKYFNSFEEQVKALNGSSTLYVGNLSFYTTELQIYETFSRVGPIKRIIMGLNRESKTPCGFCFVEYYTHENALDCLRYISGTVCDDHIVRCELDAGFKVGRQFGRGRSGGQVRDERRESHDPSRGGNFVHTENHTGKKRGRENYDRRHSSADNFGREHRRVEIVEEDKLSKGLRAERSLPNEKNLVVIVTNDMPFGREVSVEKDSQDRMEVDVDDGPRKKSARMNDDETDA